MNTAIEKEKAFAKLREDWRIEKGSNEEEHTRETFDRGWDAALDLVGVGSSAMPEGFRVYVCTDCQEVNVKKDNRKIRVGFCYACDHPLWNSAEDVLHD